MLPFVLSTLVDNDKRDKVDILYQEHYASMMFAAISFAKCEADAEDIVHDAFIKIIRFIDKIDTSDNIKTRSLCIVITKHVAIDRYRKNSSHIDVEFTDGFFEQNDEPIPLDFVLRKDGYKRLVEIIKDLK